MRSVSSIIALILISILIIYFIINTTNTYKRVNKGEPWLLKTTKSTRNNMTKVNGSLIPQSDDSKYGVEFSYAFWIYVDSWPTKDTTHSAEYSNYGTHVLHKGNYNGNIQTGDKIDPLLQAPGIWLDNSSNKMTIVMNSFDKYNNICSIDNFPIKKWVHVSVVLINKNIDLYVNGRFKKRCQMDSVPKLNYGNVYLNMTYGDEKGFDGYLSKVRYFNYALPFWKIEQILKDGPSNAPCPSTGATPPMLSSDWWVNRNNI